VGGVNVTTRSLSVAGSVSEASNNGHEPDDGYAAGALFGRDGLQVEDTARAVLAAGSIRAGLGHQLWRYHEGVWLPDGEDEVYRRTKRLLRNRWRKAHAVNVVEFLACEKPFITDEYPTQYVNTRSGLIDWRTGDLRPHTDTLPSTFQAPHLWQPRAACPTVDRWLAEVLPDDAVAMVWELLGYLLYPDNPLHLAVLLSGTGRNGKGTLLRLARHLLGARHVSAVTLQALGEDRFAGSDLYGKVANLAGDLDARSIARTDLFKMATGGDPIRADVKYGHAFVFTCRATFVFAANELPGTADLSEGFFSRWLVVPFVGHFPPGVADPGIEKRLHAEMPGVLVKAVDGLRRLMERGRFEPPESVTAATVDYRAKADPVRQFADELVIFDADKQTQRPTVYAAYRRWTEENGHHAVAARKLYDRLAQLDQRVGVKTINGIRMLDGVGLRAEDDR
jgi:putative DNA primase/helicase